MGLASTRNARPQPVLLGWQAPEDIRNRLRADGAATFEVGDQFDEDDVICAVLVALCHRSLRTKCGERRAIEQ